MKDDVFVRCARPHITFKLDNHVLDMAVDNNDFDPRVFNDPIALKSSWEPLSSWGSNISTHSLKQVNQERLELKERTGMKLFTLGILILFLYIIIKGLQEGSMLMTIVGIAFGLTFLFGKRESAETVIFDKKENLVTLKRKRKLIGEYIRTEIGLNRIHAIQLIPVYNPDKDLDSSSDDYYSYEMNLILDDGKRVLLVDQGNYEVVESQVNHLAAFLKAPVWRKPIKIS